MNAGYYTYWEVVYLLEDEGRGYKVGKSTDFDQRFDKYKTENPFIKEKFRWLVPPNGCDQAEDNLKFFLWEHKDLRMYPNNPRRKEWYRYDPKVLEVCDYAMRKWNDLLLPWGEYVVFPDGTRGDGLPAIKFDAKLDKTETDRTEALAAPVSDLSWIGWMLTFFVVSPVLMFLLSVVFRAAFIFCRDVAWFFSTYTMPFLIGAAWVGLAAIPIAACVFIYRYGMKAAGEIQQEESLYAKQNADFPKANTLTN